MNLPVNRQRRGTILIVVLVVLLLISVVAYDYMLSMQTENLAARSSGDQMVARQAAWSAMDWLSAILEAPRQQRQSLVERSNVSDPGAGILLDPQQPGDQVDGPRFLVTSPVRTGTEDSQGPSARDESTKVHLGMLIEWDKIAPGSAHETLLRIPGMTPEVADGILDWIDSDSEARAYGAEAADYERWQPRNRLPANMAELLLVRGVQESLENDRVQDNRPDGKKSPTDLNATLAAWQEHLTLYSAERNHSRNGVPRIFLNGSDLGLLYQQLVQRMPLPWAQFIVLYRQYGKGEATTAGISSQQITLDLTQPAGFQIKSILDLIDASIEIPQEGKTVNVVSPFRSDPALMPTQLPALFDQATVQKAKRVAGRININAASPGVLLAIPGMDQSLVEKIMAARSIADGGALLRYHPIWLMAEGIVNQQEMRQLLPYLNAGGDVFRADFQGQSTGTDSLYRCEAVIDATGPSANRVHFRELSPIKWPRSNDFRATTN